MSARAMAPPPKVGDLMAVYYGRFRFEPANAFLGLAKVARVTPSGQIVVHIRDERGYSIEYRFNAAGYEIGARDDHRRLQWPTDEDRAAWRVKRLAYALQRIDWSTQSAEAIEATAALLGIEAP